MLPIFSGCHGVVNWSGGYNDKGDAGNCFQIIEAADMPAGLATTIGNKLESGLVISAARTIVSDASDVRVGAYKTSAVTALSDALEAYDATGGQTEENFNSVKSAYETLIANPDAQTTLSAGEKFRVLCFDNERGYMAYSTVEGKSHETNVMVALLETARNAWKEKFPLLTDEGVYADWAIVEANGKQYIYNVEKKQCLTATGDDAKVTFSDAGTAVTKIIAYEGQPTVFEVYFEGSDSRRLSFSPGFSVEAGGVRTWSDRNDAGTKFYIEKVGTSVDDALQSEMINKISAAVLDKYNAMAALEPFSIKEGSTVVGPNEFANPEQINADIAEAKAVEDNFDAKKAFIASEAGQRLQTYIDQVKQYGALANIQIEMKAEYGTLIMPCPSSAVSGLMRKGLADTDIDENGTINIEGLEQGTFVANYPYLIQAEVGSKFTIIGWDKGSTATHTQGLLTGVLNEETEVPAGSYILSSNNGKLGFYKVAEGADYMAAKNKCYLTLPAATESRFEALYFENDTQTGINGVENVQTQQGGIYNIAGQRLSKLQKGLNIVNGKKIIVK